MAPFVASGKLFLTAAVAVKEAVTAAQAAEQAAQAAEQARTEFNAARPPVDALAAALDGLRDAVGELGEAAAAKTAAEQQDAQYRENWTREHDRAARALAASEEPWRRAAWAAAAAYERLQAATAFSLTPPVLCRG